MALQGEGWDAIQAAIYGKQDHLERGIGKSGERERERERERDKEIERESDHYVPEDCVSKEPSLLGLPEEELK